MQRQSFLNRVVVLLILGGVLFATGYLLQHTVSVLLSSFIIAYLLDPLVVLLERRGFKRIYGIAFLYALLGAFSVFCFFYLIPFLAVKWVALVHDLPNYGKQLEQLLSGRGWFGSWFVADEWRWLSDSVRSNLDGIVAKVGSGIYSAAGKVVFNLFNLLLSPILVFFMLFYKHRAALLIVSLLPPERREQILSIGRDIDRGIGGFIRGQVAVSLIVAALSAVALFILDISHPIFCAVFAGLASVIPFVGVILATLPPLFFAYAQYQSGSLLLKVCAAFAIIYFLEGYLVKPLVFKESLNLNPLVTIIMVMAFGEFMGFWGVLLAIPITASLKIVTTHLQREDGPGEVGKTGASC